MKSPEQLLKAFKKSARRPYKNTPEKSMEHSTKAFMDFARSIKAERGDEISNGEMIGIAARALAPMTKRQAQILSHIQAR